MNKLPDEIVSILKHDAELHAETADVLRRFYKAIANGEQADKTAWDFGCYLLSSVAGNDSLFREYVPNGSKKAALNFIYEHGLAVSIE